MIDIGLIFLSVGLGSIATILIQKHFRKKDERTEQHRRDELARQQQDGAREKRIQGVVSEYLGLAESHPPMNTGIPGLLQAGITELHSDEEARAVLEILARRAQRDPVRKYRQRLMDPSFDVLAVFKGWAEAVRKGGASPGIEFHEVIERCNKSD